MAALPYIQLYVADYLADTQHLTAEEHGAYMLLIFNYWQTGKPLKVSRLQSLARMFNERWTDVNETLSEFFEEVDGVWIHARIEMDLEAVKAKSLKNSEAGKASAAARAKKKQLESNGRSTGVAANVERTYQRNVNHTDTDTDTDNIKPLSASPTVEQEIFNHWKTVMNKNNSAKLNKKRLSAIKARLKEGYTEQDIKTSIDGCANTPHNMGQNDRGELYNDLELICRDGSNLERFKGNVNRVQGQLTNGPSILNIQPPAPHADYIDHEQRGIEHAPE